MYIDLFPVMGKYRGMSRSLGSQQLKSSRKWRVYFSIYEKYLDWIARQKRPGLESNIYSESAMQILIELRDERIKRDTPCEITFFSDNQDEFHIGAGFLGFDAYWVEDGTSGVEDGCSISDNHRQKLNENGLFSNYEDAQEFCDVWKAIIDENDPNPWAKETKPRPFCVWTLSE